jgi:hypothetical protein
MLDSWGGDGCCLYSYPAEFVFYADGRIILLQGFDQDGEWRYRLLTKMYSRKEMCSILNTIDRTRFLEYDAGEYRPQDSEFFSIDGSNTTAITVNAWKSNSGRFYALRSYLQFYDALTPVPDLTGFPPISPALRDLYYFLDLYPSEGLELYQPERLGLIVTNSDSAVVESHSPVVDWFFDEFSLAEIEKATSVRGYPSEFYIVEGESVRAMYSYFGNTFGSHGQNVRQNGQDYIVFARPILPYEIPQFDSWNILPDPSVKPPDFELECYPSDGIMPIPAPSTPTP